MCKKRLFYEMQYCFILHSLFSWNVMNPIFSHYRYGVSFKIVAGGSKSVTKEMATPWKQTTLPTILSCYACKGIFNEDEFGLFYQALLSKIMHFKDQQCSDGKHSKVDLTGLSVGNAFEKKLPMFIIGKS